MTGKQVLITGGAGFVGSHVADQLLDHGYRVRALDNLSPQVHGPDARRPEHLHPDVELMIGDVRSPDTVRRALKGVDAVLHLAAAVGVGQSMYEIAEYTSVNSHGTAVLLEAISKRPVERLVVASSMSLYGEGLYRRPDDGIAPAFSRSVEQLKRRDWELHDEEGTTLVPVATPETKTPDFQSVYALSKYDQEQLCLMIGRAYGVPTVALRFFNVYGTRQALSNPYTGVLAIFASRLLNGMPPLLYEDGLQRRDFVSVRDVAQACRLALESNVAVQGVFNVGSGRATTIRNVADRLSEVLGRPDLPALVLGRYRVGDIRHCFADITLAKDVLGYEPQVMLEDGLLELAGWLEGRTAHDRVHHAAAELAARGLTL